MVTMKMTSLRRTRGSTLPGITGTARVDRRTHGLVKRARPGDIAIIDHIDIDRGAAAALVDAGVVAVVNLAPSVSGRYPNLGPGLLLDAGVILIDQVDTDAFTQISDGEQVRSRRRQPVQRRPARRLRRAADRRHRSPKALEASKDGMASQLEAFSANAIEHLRREQGLLLDGEGVPSVATSFDGTTGAGRLARLRLQERPRLTQDLHPGELAGPGRCGRRCGRVARGRLSARR